MGGKNPFLGIAYVVVGGLCIVLGVVFTVAHLVKPRHVFPLILEQISTLTRFKKIGRSYLSFMEQ